MTENEAVILLGKRVDYESDPALTTDELEDLIDRSARAVTWTAATAYDYGTLVVPTARNGHHYKVIEAGTSGTTEPDWLTETDAIQNDGTAWWQEAGSDWPDLWDLDAAAYEGWLLKASRAAAAYNFTADGQTFNRGSLVEHCERMAARWAPARFY